MSQRSAKINSRELLNVQLTFGLVLEILFLIVLGQARHMVFGSNFMKQYKVLVRLDELDEEIGIRFDCEGGSYFIPFKNFNELMAQPKVNSVGQVKIC